VFVFPFAYLKNLSSLSWISIFSVTTFGIIAIIVLVTGIRTPNQPSNYVPMNWQGFLKAFGTLSFAFVCTDSIFPVYIELENRTQKRWNRVVHLSIGFLGGLYAIFSIICYFLIPKLGDYTLNSDSIVGFTEIKVSKGLLVVTILLTYLSNLHVCRTYVYAIVEKCSKPLSSYKRRNYILIHILVTSLLILITTTLGVFIGDLMFIINLTGSISSTVVGFVIPAMIIFKVKTVKKVWEDFKTAFTGKVGCLTRLRGILHFLFPIVIFIFGILGFCVGVPTLIIDYVKSK